MTSPTPHGGRRFRYGLRTLLGFMLFLAMGLALGLTTRELLQLRKENAKLRAEAGYLTVKDPLKVAVLAIHTLDDLTWRWKVHLPKGQWVLHHATRNIPKTGFPDKADTAHGTGWGPATTTPIDTTVEASVRKSAAGEWQLVLQYQGGIRTALGSQHALAAPRSTSWNAAGSGLEETFNPDESVVLLRLRAIPAPGATAGNAQIPTTPCDGLMLWLEDAANPGHRTQIRNP